RDVLTAADDHVINATCDEQIAVRVEIAGVAGEIPSFPNGLGVGFRPPPIAFERLVAQELRDHLAFLSSGGNLVGRSGTKSNDAHALIDPGAPGRARLCRGVLVNSEGVDFR